MTVKEGVNYSVLTPLEDWDETLYKKDCYFLMWEFSRTPPFYRKPIFKFFFGANETRGDFDQ